MEIIPTLFRQLARTSVGGVPAQHRSNFIHLYLDIAWFGILTGSAVSFISIYLVRIGASGFQIGLFSALPALVALGAALPSGWWLKRKPLGKAVFWSSVLFRLFYLLWVPLPLIFGPGMQIWVLIALTFGMSIPGTALAVGFNALFASTVPVEFRGKVAGVRNALLALTVTITSILCGYLLEQLPFPVSYQVVFGIGFAGAALSSLHLGLIRVPGGVSPGTPNGPGLGDMARPGGLRTLGDTLRTEVGLRFLTRLHVPGLPRRSRLNRSYRAVLSSLFAFHFTQYLAIPLFSLYWVGELDFSDQVLSIGTALFYTLVFLGSTQLGGLTRRLGNYRLLVLGSTMMAAYPALTAVTRETYVYLFTAMVGGIAWAITGGALSNYLLDQIPDGERPAYLAWYNLVLNAAILLGSLAGPMLADQVGLSAAFAWIALGRLASAMLIRFLGRPDQILSASKQAA